MLITSLSNPKIKDVYALKDKKRRLSARMFIAEGVNLIKDIPANVEILTYVVGENFAKADFKFRAGAEILTVGERVFKKLSDVDTPQEILAVIKMTDSQRVLTDSGILVLDGIRDPGNLGTLFRSAAAFGFLNVVLIDCADAYAPKTVRASMGGIFSLNLREQNRTDALNDVDRGEYTLIGLDMKGESILKYTQNESIPRCDKIGNTTQNPKKYAVIVGGEASGISAELLRRCDKTLSIDMQNAVESLNASVAGSIAMYILSRNADRRL
ncbi:MAG: RNA methyltransferase [Clostridiales bacterium]|jgi:TrmH family RNA methyltransferase|nr:RNA methyltransferase [Clostridiales bacterium]